MTAGHPSIVLAATLLVACRPAEGPGAATTTGESCQTECIDDEGPPSATDAAALVSTSQGSFLLLGDMLEHAVHLGLESATAAHGDVDGDGLDDILLDQVAILGLDDGTADAPLAAACQAPLDLVQPGRRTLARRAAGEPAYLVLWDQPAAPVPQLYLLEPS